MAAPKLYLGATDSIKLLEVESGYTDDGTLYDLLATTDKVAIDGVGGELAFYYIRVPVEHEHQVVIKVTPIIDGVALDAVSYTLERPTARRLRLVEVPILQAFPSSVSGFATLARFVGRGAWIQCQVETVHIADVQAAVTTALTGTNNDLVFTALAGLGLLGNDITVRYVNPGTPSAALSVDVTGSAITVNLATDGASAITTTAGQIITAIAADEDAAALVVATNAAANDGTGIVIAMAATALTGGVDGPGYVAVNGVEVEYKAVQVSTTSGSNK